MRVWQSLATSVSVALMATGCSGSPDRAPRSGGTQEQMNLIMNNPHIPPDQKEKIRADIEQQKQRQRPKQSN
jgi:hypothetical protein